MKLRIYIILLSIFFPPPSPPTVLASLLSLSHQSVQLDGLVLESIILSSYTVLLLSFLFPSPLSPITVDRLVFSPYWRS